MQVTQNGVPIGTVAEDGLQTISPAQFAALENIFSREVFLASNPGLASLSQLELLRYFIHHAFFDPNYYSWLNSFSRVYNSDHYLAQNPDVANAFNGNPARALLHFLNWGMDEGRNSIAGWNVHTYKAKYPDLQQAFGNNMRQYYYHFCIYGYYEGRTG